MRPHTTHMCQRHSSFRRRPHPRQRPRPPQPYPYPYQSRSLPNKSQQKSTLRAKLHVPSRMSRYCTVTTYIPPLRLCTKKILYCSLNSKGQAQLFVNIRNSETETTLLFDCYNKNIPVSNSVRGEKCDSTTEQVYVRLTFLFFHPTPIVGE